MVGLKMDPNVVLWVGVCFNSHAVKRFKAGLSTSLSIVQGVNHEYLYYKFLVFWERIKALLAVPFATKFFGRLLLPRFSRQKLGIYTQKNFLSGLDCKFSSQMTGTIHFFWKSETVQRHSQTVLGMMYKFKIISRKIKWALWLSTLDTIGDGAIWVQLSSVTTEPSEILSIA